MIGLQGKRVLVTRAREQAPGLAKLLEARGATAISIPSIEIVPPQSFQPLDKALKKIQSYDWLILTSVNGVSALRRRMERADVSPGLVKHLHICAIGPATKQEIEKQLSLQVEIVPEEYVAESVVAALKDKVAGKKVLLVRAKVARDVIPKELRSVGAEVDIAEAYETVTPVNSAKKLAETLAAPDRPHAITFTSSSTARNFTAILPKNVSPRELLAGVTLASIGPVTSKTLRDIGLWVDVEAQEYTMQGLVSALDDYFSAS